MKLWPNKEEQDKAIRNLLRCARKWSDKKTRMNKHNLECAIYECESIPHAEPEANEPPQRP